MFSRNPIWPKPLLVRLGSACRGRRAWHVEKEQTGTWEALRVPAALTARAKREGECNDKKHCLAIRESDWPIVTRGKAAAPNRAKEPTHQRSLHRKPAP